ncbi:hypothetical protein [Accumulibacter sp.]|uniref:hypothetical protein n=1 Tax=Accumulibacter sp. TaxID=2053492 RepID=UPI0025E809BB|nr:hypothetical protein [Accumulibacter sp.]MCP5227407.1 hypothetical protein [Accumulibacter sp.]
MPHSIPPGGSPGTIPIDIHCEPRSATTRSLAWAVAVSLIVHAVVLFFPRKEPPRLRALSSRFEATLSLAPRMEAKPLPPAPPVPPARVTPPPRPRPVKPPEPPRPPTPPKRVQAKPSAPAKPAVRKPATQPDKPQPRRPVIAVPELRAPAVNDSSQWFKDDMKDFLDDLEAQARPAARPSLAKRSLAMASREGRQQARQDEEGTAMLERVPDTPPPPPFSLDFYLDGVVNRLNRSAAFVRNDPRSKGVHMAAVHFRINPDGSLNTFRVLNAGDQQEEIAFIRSVVERAIPFAAFPPDIARSARSLGMTICIQPGIGGGFGFARLPEGSGC